MTKCYDLDLADPSAQLPVRPAPAWVLVRHGQRVLGEVQLGPDDARSRDEICRDLERRFSVAVRSRQLLDAPPPTELQPSDVAVVVCTRDRPHHLNLCLRALRALDPAPAEIIVVDNASTGTSTRELVISHGMRYVREEQPGLNHARNTGWRATSSAVVAYVDDDARADRHFVAAIAQGFSSPEISVVTGLVRPAELASRAQRAFEQIEGGMGKGYERRLFHAGHAPVGVHTYRCGVGTNMAVRRTVLDAIDGFDVRVGVGTPTRGGYELDLFVRVLTAGHSIAYEPHAVVRHVHRRTTSGLLAQMRDRGLTFSSTLRLYEREGRLSSTAVTRELVCWHWRRHLRRPLTAARRRNWMAVSLCLAELRGSLGAKRAVAATPPRAPA